MRLGSSGQMAALAKIAKTHMARNGGGDQGVYNVIVKELLHREILAAFHDTDLAKKLAFQGGTALRLCYGGNRYSEDIDMCLRKKDAEPVTEQDIADFKESLKERVEKKYGVITGMKDPKGGSVEFDDGVDVDVKKWVFSVQIADEHHPDKKHKIHIEIANVYALDARPTVIQNPYQNEFSPNANTFFIPVCSAKEIYADKFVAFVGRDYIKPRDIWDIKFLKDLQYKWDPQMIENKVGQYGICEGDFEKALNSALNRSSKLLEKEFIQKFEDEMSRFLSSQAFDSIKDDIEAYIFDIADHFQHQVAFMKMGATHGGSHAENKIKR